MEAARPDEALTLIQATLDHHDSTPVDHAWLTVQYARACVDVGRFDEARAAAETVQTIRLTHAHDVTATAIAGTAALLLYILADLGTGDTAAAISGMDTTAVWWRFQHIAGGTAAAIERDFTTWTRRSITVLAGDDTANNELAVASLLASHLGDHASWRSSESLNIQQKFLGIGRNSEPDRVADMLTALRQAGDDRALERALGRIVTDGPSAAITAAASRIDFAHWTRTTSRTNLTLLQHGGDVLDQSTAQAAVAWLLATLIDNQTFRTRTRPTFLVELRLVQTLAGVAAAAPPEDRHTIAERIVSLSAQLDQAIATAWAHVVQALPADTWGDDLASRAVAAATTHHDALRLALLGALVAVNNDARQQLLAEVGDGSLDALKAFKDVSKLPDDAVSALLATLEPLAMSKINQAKDNAWGFSGFDVGQALAVLNVTHPAVARWEPLYALLEEPQVAANDKNGACDTLAGWTDQLGPHVRARLTAIVTGMLDNPASLAERVDGHADALGPAAHLAANLCDGSQVAESLLVKLLGGDQDHRSYAARVAAGRLELPAAIGILAPLTQDPHANVRAAAASASAHLVANGTDSHLAQAVLRQAIREPGILVPLSVARTLARHRELPATARELLDELTSHRSASVRTAAADA